MGEPGFAPSEVHTRVVRSLRVNGRDRPPILGGCLGLTLPNNVLIGDRSFAVCSLERS
jgi:hypothetical protein